MTYHIFRSRAQTLTAEIHTDQTAGTGRVDIRTVALQVEEPADAIGIERQRGSQRCRRAAFFPISKGKVLPVRRETPNVDRCLRSCNSLHWHTSCSIPRLACVDKPLIAGTMSSTNHSPARDMCTPAEAAVVDPYTRHRWLTSRRRAHHTPRDPVRGNVLF